MSSTKQKNLPVGKVSQSDPTYCLPVFTLWLSRMYQRMASPSAASTDTHSFTPTPLHSHCWGTSQLPICRAWGSAKQEEGKRGGFPGLLVQYFSPGGSCSSPACSGMIQCSHQPIHELKHSCVTSIASAQQARQQAANHIRAD